MADAAREELRLAGLPIIRDDDGAGSGAYVEVDRDASIGGAITVSWNLAGEVREAVRRCVLEKRFADPEMDRLGRVASAMQEAIISILRSAGFSVGIPRNDLEPLSVEIFAGPEEGA